MPATACKLDLVEATVTAQGTQLALHDINKVGGEREQGPAVSGVCVRRAAPLCCATETNAILLSNYISLKKKQKTKKEHKSANGWITDSSGHELRQIPVDGEVRAGVHCSPRGRKARTPFR